MIDGTNVGLPTDIGKGVPVKVLQVLQKQPHLRGAGRLWCYLRRFVGSKYHPRQQRALLLQHFSPYQIDRYCKLLLEHGYLRRDRSGNYYTQAMRTVCPPSGRRRLCVDVPDAVLQDHRAWKDFITGVTVAAYARALRYGRTRKRAAMYVATNDPSGVVELSPGLTAASSSLSAYSNVQGCSLSLLSRHAGVHKSTASRWRRRGRTAGYELARWFYRLPFELTRLDIYRLRELGLPNLDPNRLVLRRGRIFEEGPSQVCYPNTLLYMRRNS